MSSQLHLVCNRFIEACWLSSFILIPLHFNPATSRIYEPDKIALLRSIAVCVAAAWLIKAVEAWIARRQQRAAPPPEAAPRLRWRHPASRTLVLATLLLLASHTLSTVFSILPATSLWGHYERLHGLYTLAAYLVLFFSMLALLRTPAQVQRLITTVLLVSLPMALYGIAQHFDIEPQGWIVSLSERVPSTMGNPIFLGATLCMTIPLTLYRLLDAERDALAPEARPGARKLRLLGGATVVVQVGGWSVGLAAGSLVALMLVAAWCLVPRWLQRPCGPFLRWSVYLLLLSLQLACLLFTQSRGPVLGLLTGLFLGALLWTVTRHRRRAALGLVGLGTFLALLLVGINLSGRALDVVSEIPYLNRLVQLKNEERSSQGRILIWEGAIDLISATPARMGVGYGPETIRSAYFPYYSARIGRLEGWDVFPDRLHNATLDVVATTGLLGAAVYLLLFTGVVYFGLSRLGLLATTAQRTGFMVLWLAGGGGAILGLRGLMHTWTFSGVALPLGLLGGLFLYLTGYALLIRPESNPDQEPASRQGEALFILLLTGILVHFVETDVGIAISATQLLFWGYAALLLVAGLPEDTSTPRDSATAPEQKPEARSHRRRPSKARRRAKVKPSGEQPPSDPRIRAESLGIGLILLTLAYSFTTPGVSDEKLGLISVFMLAIWLLLGLILGAGPSGASQPRYRLRHLGQYVILTLAPLFLLILLRAAGVDMKNHQLLGYYALVLLTMAAQSMLLPGDAPSKRRPLSPWRIALASVSILIALFFIYESNIQAIQANIDHRQATAAYTQRRYDLAMTWYRQAMARDPHQERYQMELAQALAAQAIFGTRVASDREQLLHEAEQNLLRATERNPFDPYYWAQLAEVYRVWANVDAPNRETRYQEALAALEQAVQHNAENIAFLTKWAELYEEKGERTQALATYRRALALDTTNAPLYMKIGRYYQEANQWQPAAAMYKAALRHRTQPGPAVHHTLAVLYQRLGRQEEAARQSEQAVALAPDVLAHHTLLIDLYVDLGRCTDALARTREALRRWPAEGALQTRADLITRQCAEQPAPG